MLAQQVHGEGGRERLRVQFSPQPSRTHLFEEKCQDSLGVGIVGIEDVHNLHTIGVDVGPCGDPPDEIPPQKHVYVVRNRPLERPLQRLVTGEHLDEAGDQRPLVRPPNRVTTLPLPPRRKFTVWPRSGGTSISLGR
jgi:hypothetical protein